MRSRQRHDPRGPFLNEAQVSADLMEQAVDVACKGQSVGVA